MRWYRLPIIVGLLLASALALAQAQSTRTFENYVSGLPAASALAATDQVYVLQGGVSKKLAGSAIVSGSSGTVLSGAAGQDAYYSSSSTTVTGTPANVINVARAPYNCSPSNSAAANATCLTNAFAALSAAGGGTLFVPPATSAYVVGCFTIPNDGTSSPVAHQPPFRLTSTANSRGYLSLQQGAQLDLRCNTNARITTLGAGTLEIDHIALVNGNTGGGDTVPFILATNTNLYLHDTTIIGDTGLVGTANIQDAIQLGGTPGSSEGNLPTSTFGGYGTVIDNNWFDHVQRVAWLNSTFFLVNAVQITRNVIWFSAGSSSFAAIYCSGNCEGNIVSDNLFDLNLNNQYPYFFDFAGGVQNIFRGNLFFDGLPATSFFHFSVGAGALPPSANLIECSTCYAAGSPPVVTGGAGATGAGVYSLIGTGGPSIFGNPFYFKGAIYGFPQGGNGTPAISLTQFGEIDISNSNTDPTTACQQRFFPYAFVLSDAAYAFDNCNNNQPVDLVFANSYSRRPTAAKTSNYQITGNGTVSAASDNNTVFVNTGATTQVSFTMPVSGNLSGGETFTFYVTAAATMQVVAGAGQTIQVNTSTSSSGGTASCATIGCALTLVYRAGVWMATSIVNTWGTT